jgi:hypothetical protein
MANRNRPHIVVPTAAVAEPYSPHPPKFDRVRLPVPPDPVAHGEVLTTSLKTAKIDAAVRREHAKTLIPEGAKPGLYIQFDSIENVPLKLESLENKTKHIELCAVQEVEVEDLHGKKKTVQRATVFVPDGAVGHFLKRFEEYNTGTTASGARKHIDLVDRIAALRLATLQALWTDTEAYPEPDTEIWWEVWLRRDDDAEIERFRSFATKSGIQVSERHLKFEDRTVVLARAKAMQLSASIDVLNDLAEVRRAKETANFFVNLNGYDQALWTDAMRDQLVAPTANAPAVCLLDTGVNRAHPLIERFLASADCHTIKPAWTAQDNDGHGTEMAGLALYGDLTSILASSGPPTSPGHILESVKVLPPQGHAPNPPDLYGAVIASAASQAEIQAPTRRRTFAMAVTSIDERDRGQPTSWSSAIDALAAGRSFDPTTQGLIYLDNAEENAHRLFVLAAGNVNSLNQNHLDVSDTEGIHDPAQAWNALTVGACTNLVTIDPNEPGRNGFTALAESGDLSPWSTTSVPFAREWPIKPEVVFEGGNVGKSPAGAPDFPIDSLSVLTTHYKPAEKLLTTSWATSAAMAQLARFTGAILKESPQFTPETIRALIVQSAQWTPRMRGCFDLAKSKTARESLVRRYGFGVPDLDRALRSAKNALTLIVEDTILPFEDGKLRQMHVHALPWPLKVLASLGELPVKMRITLSYFVEPNPGRRGWKKRHRYASHGLRFEAKAPTESVEEFRKRINKRALDEDEEKPDTGDSSGWFLGSRIRNKGSLHADIWVGTAADLAARGHIIVYPVSGWWKDQPKRDRSSFGAQYSLIVSIETESSDVDIWTPVAQQVGITIPGAIEL